MPNRTGEPIAEDDIRAALARVVASVRFRESPRMVSFLRYVVEQTLDGKAAQIKGYTIAIEALGRDASFDPNTQSIVRTEAARLRQELARYYAEAGADDPVRIELPRGRYVPEFHRHLPGEPDSPPGPEAPPESEPSRRHGWLHRPKALAPLQIVVLATVFLVAYGVLDYLILTPVVVSGPESIASSMPHPPPPKPRLRNGEPSLLIEPVTTEGPTPERAIDVGRLHYRLVDVLSRFEDVIVMTAAPGTGDAVTAAVLGRAPDYVLTPMVAYAASGAASLQIRLTASADHSVLWQAAYELQPDVAEPGPAADRLMLKISTALLQPFGIIPAAERRTPREKSAALPFRCTIDTVELVRYSDPVLREKTRHCLQEAIAADPSFGLGYVALARMFYRDYLFAERDEPELLTKALSLARHAVEYEPTSARAHYTVMNIQVARGFVDDGLAMGRRAYELNPYDFRVLLVYGVQLVTLGKVEEGEKLLEAAREGATVFPVPLAWGLFLVAYLKGDWQTAALHADQMEGEFAINLLARAMLAANTGDPAAARTALAQLRELYPGWTVSPRSRLARFLPSKEILDRVTGDLRRAVFAPSN